MGTNVISLLKWSYIPLQIVSLILLWDTVLQGSSAWQHTEKPYETRTVQLAGQTESRSLSFLKSGMYDIHGLSTSLEFVNDKMNTQIAFKIKITDIKK